MIMIGLGITLILLVGMFLYVRSKLAHYDVRLRLLSDTVQTMAGITRSNHSYSTDTESESETNEYSESDSGEESDREIQSEVPEPVPVQEYENVVVSDDEIDVKMVEVSDLDKLSVKELRDMLVQQNGPKLKTKKEMIEYLNKKSNE